MRTFGRQYQRDSNGRIVPGTKGVWVEVATDAAGFDDAVWITTLAQVLQGNINESPFYANYGIDQHQSVISQIFPDFRMMVTQAQFAQYFASLIITRQSGSSPSYVVNVMTNRGERLTAQIAV